MARLRDLMAEAHPFLLLGAWSLASVLAAVWMAVLPGDPSYAGSGTGGIIWTAALTGVFALFMGLGSRLAWWLVIFFDVTAIAFSLAVLLDGDDGVVKPVGLAILLATALWLIWSGGLEDYLLSERRGRREATQLH